LVNVNATTIASTIAAARHTDNGRHAEHHQHGTANMGAAVTEFEFVTCGFGNHLHGQQHWSLIITGSTGADTITTGNAVQTVNAGTGNDTITLGAAGQTINGEDGTTTVNVNATTIASTIDGGEGAESGDTLNVTGGSTVTWVVA
jgi:Ca2+-binding RTX toxin-like protein